MEEDQHGQRKDFAMKAMKDDNEEYERERGDSENDTDKQCIDSIILKYNERYRTVCLRGPHGKDQHVRKISRESNERWCTHARPRTERLTVRMIQNDKEVVQCMCGEKKKKTWNV